MKKRIISITLFSLIVFSGCGDIYNNNVYGDNNSVGNEKTVNGINVEVPVDVDIDINSNNDTQNNDNDNNNDKLNDAIPEPIATPEPTVEPTPTPEPEPELISIMEVSEFYSDGINHSKYTITDNIGNTYNGYTYMVAGDFWLELEGSVVYRNDNQYNRFFGWVIINDVEKDDENCGWIKIYGDDVLLFDTGTMGRGIEPKNFDLDISMYSEIKIDFQDGNWSSKSYCYPQCYLVDTYFEVIVK